MRPASPGPCPSAPRRRSRQRPPRRARSARRRKAPPASIASIRRAGRLRGRRGPVSPPPHTARSHRSAACRPPQRGHRVGWSARATGIDLRVLHGRQDVANGVTGDRIAGAHRRFEVLFETWRTGDSAIRTFQSSSLTRLSRRLTRARPEAALRRAGENGDEAPFVRHLGHHS